MPIKNLVVLAVCTIISLTCYFAASRTRFANLFAEVVELVGREHLAAPERRELFDAAIDGMLGDLDPHSTYLAGREYVTFDENIEQEFGGVGMYVEVDPTTRFLMVSVPMPGTPAFLAGLQPRDLILSIAGTSTLDRERRECIGLMRGPIGEPVTLEIRRGERTFPVTLNRAVIPVTSVFGDTTSPDGTRNFFLEQYPRIGYLRIDQFGHRTTEETRAALEGLKDRVDGLVIDLRNNGGGPLDAAVAIADMFLPGNLTIVETRGRDRKLLEQIRSTSGTILPEGIPLAILVNRNTASASEIVAACLQDHGRAIVVGERTYGKGTVQNVYVLEPQRSAVKLTTASYWPPGGRCIDRNDPAAKESGQWGVLPNPGFEIETDEEQIVQLYIQRQTREIEGLLSGGKGAGKDGTAEAAEGNDDSPSRADTEAEAASPDAKGNEKASPGTAPVDAAADPAELKAEEKPQLDLIDQPLQKAIEWIRQRTGSVPETDEEVAAGAS